MRVQCLQNHCKVPPGAVQNWARQAGHAFANAQLFLDHPLPELDSFDVLVVLGGNPLECTAWLETEMDFIRRAVAANKAVLGLCLGAQLIAEALGGKLIPHDHSETGWWSVQLNEQAANHPLLRGVPQQLDIYMFHRNTYRLPPGAVSLGSSQGCAAQVFAYGDRVLGFQGHPEFTEQTISTLWHEHREVMPDGPFTRQRPDDARQALKIEATWAALSAVLENLSSALNEPAAVA